MAGRTRRARSRTTAAKRKSATVKKLSPEQPAARDEGPRLIPLNAAAKDSGLARIEYYLGLADKALGHPAGRPEAAVLAADSPRPEVPSRSELPPPHDATLLPIPESPKLATPKPPLSPSRPYPPRLAVPRPPKGSSFPKPPKLSLPKPPKRVR